MENKSQEFILIMKGGDYMIKKITLATGAFAIAALTAATMTFAQTSTPRTSPAVTTSPTTTVPAMAPKTGRAN